MAAPSAPVRSKGCFASLACSIGSISIAFSSLTQIPNTTDRISLQRGLFLTSLGFIYFVSLTDFCNKYLLETKHGQQFRKKYRLMLSDVLEITNKIVSAVQAFFSFLVGLIVCKSTCSKSFVYASHFLMEAYGWFGTAYFMYDIWSMYKVHTQMLADKLKLKNLSMKFDGSKDENHLPTIANGITNKKHSNKDGKLKMNGNYNHKNGKMIGNGNGSIYERPQQNGAIVSHKPNQLYDDPLYEEANLKNEQYQRGSRMEFFKYVFTHPVMMIHHIFIGTFGFLVVTYIRGGGHCIYSYMFMMEFSTPFVSLRSILSTMHLKDTKLYIVNGLTMLVAFFICRVFMWPYVMWRYSLAINTTFWQALSGLPKGCIISILILFLPQIYWFYLMVRGALKVFFPSSSSSKHKKNQAGVKSKEDDVLFQNNNSSLESSLKEAAIFLSEHQKQNVPVN